MGGATPGRIMTTKRRRAGGRPSSSGRLRTGTTAFGRPTVEGLSYIDDFLTQDEERDVLGVIEPLDYRAVAMHGQTARRTVRMFGLDYDYSSRDVVPADPLPESLGWLRERAAGLIERDPEDLAQILVSRYPAGAGIGWHRDAPMFGSKIVGVSLHAPARMRFQRTVKGAPARSRRSSSHRAPRTCSPARRAGRGSTQCRRRKSCATRSRSGRSGGSAADAHAGRHRLGALALEPSDRLHVRQAGRVRLVRIAV